MPSATLLAAFSANTPLHEIISTHKLTLEDLHAFLSSPGIPERLEALRTLTNFSEDLQSSAGRQEATAYLRGFLKDDHEPVETRRAATALLRGPARAPSRAPASHDRNPAGRREVSDWIALSPDIDAQEDEDLDNPDGAAEADAKRAGSRADQAAPPPLTATPDQLVAHQLRLIRAVNKPTLTPQDIVHAIDSHRLAFPNRYYGDRADAFRAGLTNNPILDIEDAELVPDPAVIHDTSPPTATIRVTIKRRPPSSPPDPALSPRAQCPIPDASCCFHLIYESTYFPDPASPLAWHTQAITTDSG